MMKGTKKTVGKHYVHWSKPIPIKPGQYSPDDISAMIDEYNKCVDSNFDRGKEIERMMKIVDNAENFIDENVTDTNVHSLELLEKLGVIFNQLIPNYLPFMKGDGISSKLSEGGEIRGIVVNNNEPRTEFHGCTLWQICNHGETCPSDSQATCPDWIRAHAIKILKDMLVKEHCRNCNDFQDGKMQCGDDLCKEFKQKIATCTSMKVRLAKEGDGDGQE